MEAETSAFLKDRTSHIQASPLILSEHQKRKAKREVLLEMYRILNKKTGNPVTTIRLLASFKKKYQNIFGGKMMSKIAEVDGRTFHRLGSPGFPSRASQKMYENEFSRLMSDEVPKGLRTLIIAITKKCPLNCEHCFEWENLNKEETMSADELIDMVRSYQDYGTTQIMFSGGEPLMRKNDLLEILDSTQPGTDFWIITSGLGLNLENARLLKERGLTGVMVSLDHHEAAQHNQFRGNKKAFDWAVSAVKNSNEVGLVTALSLCATRAYTAPENLSRYMDLAKSLGVSFVQILEAREAGRYKGKDVMLEAHHLKLIDETYLKYNSEKRYASYPIVNSLGYHQRRIGCFGGGNRFFYIDTDGDAHLCPYCVGKSSNAVHNSPEQVIDRLKQGSCHVFEESLI